MKETKILAPWYRYYNKIKALFGSDPDIRLELDEEDKILRMYVNGQEKSDAIGQLLPSQVELGNIRLYIDVIPANSDQDNASLFRKAFDGNPAVSYLANVMVNGGIFKYLVFRNAVIQYYDDNLQDPHGLRSTLYQEIAKEVFPEDVREGIFFTTDKPDNLGYLKKGEE